jgi:hypothetical protein
MRKPSLKPKQIYILQKVATPGSRHLNPLHQLHGTSMTTSSRSAMARTSSPRLRPIWLPHSRYSILSPIRPSLNELTHISTLLLHKSNACGKITRPSKLNPATLTTRWVIAPAMTRSTNWISGPTSTTEISSTLIGSATRPSGIGSTSTMRSMACPSANRGSQGRRGHDDQQ